MLNQKLQLKLSQKLSPQQIQLMKLIQMTTAELEQKVKNEIEENPALEHGSEVSESFEDDPSEFDSDVNNEDIDVDDYISDQNDDYSQNFYSTNEEYNNFQTRSSPSFHQYGLHTPLDADKRHDPSFYLLRRIILISLRFMHGYGAGTYPATF